MSCLNSSEIENYMAQEHKQDQVRIQSFNGTIFALLCTKVLGQLVDTFSFYLNKIEIMVI